MVLVTFCRIHTTHCCWRSYEMIYGNKSSQINCSTYYAQIEDKHACADSHTHTLSPPLSCSVEYTN
jgi:hypothetical protein